MSARSFSYSKWDNIELSDDESDLHPNIDKESWFRMKHRTRLEREAKEDEECKLMNKQNEEDGARVSIIKARLDNLSKGQADDEAEFEDVDALNGELNELETRISKRNQAMDEIQKRRSWNIDNICKVKEERSFVNSNEAKSLKAEDFKPTGVTEKKFAAESSTSSTTSLPEPPKKDKTIASKTNEGSAVTPSAIVAPPAVPDTPVVLGPSEPAKSIKNNLKDRLSLLSYNDFVLSQETVLETYSEIQDLEKTKEYLFAHCDILLHEHSQSYMLLSSLEDEMNKKHRRMKLVCRQSQILSHITELATSMRKDPRDVILPFFKRLEERTHLEGFNVAVQEFIDKIKKRAVEKRREMDMEREAEERKREEKLRKHKESGGLDPYEVLAALPEELRSAFESQDMERLQSVLTSMDPEEAKKWMKMCVDSGLWVPKDSSVYEEGEEDEEEDEGVEEGGEVAEAPGV